VGEEAVIIYFKTCHGKYLEELGKAMKTLTE
jgi:hypothetical protein